MNLITPELLSALDSLKEEGKKTGVDFMNSRLEPLDELLPVQDPRLIVIKKFRQSIEDSEKDSDGKISQRIKQYLIERGIEGKVQQAYTLRKIGCKRNLILSITGIKRRTYVNHVGTLFRGSRDYRAYDAKESRLICVCC